MARRCTRPGCTAPERCRGVCPRHYYAARRDGTADALPTRYPHSRPQTYCPVLGCEKPVHARGHCQRHYTRLREAEAWVATHRRSA